MKQSKKCEPQNWLILAEEKGPGEVMSFSVESQSNVYGFCFGCLLILIRLGTLFIRFSGSCGGISCQQDLI